MSAIVTLKKGEGRTIKAGGAWIFDNEIDSVTGAFENGDVVMVHDFDGYPMGRGFINMHSKIRIRMLTRNPDQEIDEEFFRERLRDAWEYRKKTVDTGSCRIVFGEADFLPGLVVDKFSDVLVFQCLALGMDRYKEKLLFMLKELLADDMIQRRSYDEIPPRVEYCLSEKGKTVVPILQSICRWSGAYTKDDQAGLLRQCQKCDFLKN